MLIAEDIYKEYPTRDAPLAILRGVSLKVEAGEAVAIVGPSGSGKSTLLNIVGTLEPPTRGRVELGGVDPFALPERDLARFRNRQIGFVFQDHHLLAACSALENVLLPTLAGAADAGALERARRLLADVGLGRRLDHRSAELSGGEKQRVALARALINGPQLVLADEPTGNLDQTTAEQVGELLAALPERQQVALVVVTHSPTLAARFGRRLRLDAGRLVPEQTPTMRLATLMLRRLVYHAGALIPVSLGVATGVAALVGALLVGDSLRGSLRDTALARLGGTELIVQAPRFFRPDLLAESNLPGGPGIIALRGGVSHADTQASAVQVGLLGVPADIYAIDTLGVLLNATLTRDIGARTGDDVVLRFNAPAAISPELLVGRRDTPPLTLRLTVRGVLPGQGLADFSLTPQQTPPRNAFVNLAALQRAVHQPGRVNTLLVRKHGREERPSVDDARAAVQAGYRLADVGLAVRADQQHGYLALESDALLLPLAGEQAGRAAAEKLGWSATGLLANLANTIARSGAADPTIPYSTVLAVEGPHDDAATQPAAPMLPAPHPGEIVLNAWAADALDARVGETLRLTYYDLRDYGALYEVDAVFQLAGVVPLAGAVADSGLVPGYPGLTDATRMSDWNSPFPIDLARIGPRDEAYWDTYRAAPKAFINLADGQRLWIAAPERFGQLTALRVTPTAEVPLAGAASQFETAVQARLDPARLGLRVEDVRARALAASVGATDFAGLFVGFSFFIIVAAALLVALLFRLHLERRAGDVGLLLAIGFTRRRIAQLCLGEGVAVALVGALVGVLLGRGYAALLLGGLRTWWSDAVKAPFLTLHETPQSYAIGLIGGLVVALAAIAFGLRGLTRMSPRVLLAGNVENATAIARQCGGFMRVFVPVTLLVAGLAVLIAPLVKLLSATSAFFAGGALLLAAGLAALRSWLRAAPARRPIQPGPFALARLGMQNLRRAPQRSLLTAGLVASAAFAILALQALRLTAPVDVGDRHGPTGGYTLLAETAVPILADLDNPAERAAVGLADDRTLAGVEFVPLRVHAGDDASCLNLYAPTQPRVLGATPRLIERGGFSFAGTLATDAAERGNPWQLLEGTGGDDAIPAIADEATALWQLHKRLGDVITLPDERGRGIHLRLVGLLRGSIVQGALIVSAERFGQLFPTDSGYPFWLIATPPAQAETIKGVLERGLRAYGCAVTPTAQRLAELQAVQNTYLATFQALGGLGLLLGTLGLAAALLRGMWERRSELALLRTLGFSRGALGRMVLAESVVLVGLGLAIGTLAAAVVVAPHVATRGAAVPWGSVLGLFATILLVNLLAGAVATRVALRTALLPALRHE